MTYIGCLAVNKINSAGKPKMAASKKSGIHCGSDMNVEAIKTPVKVMAAGSTSVPARVKSGIIESRGKNDDKQIT